jgi:hypothetical protein
MIGRADIEGSKSHVAMNAWRPQASYPCGNISEPSFIKRRNKRSEEETHKLSKFTEVCEASFICTVCGLLPGGRPDTESYGTRYYSGEPCCGRDKCRPRVDFRQTPHAFIFLTLAGPTLLFSILASSSSFIHVVLYKRHAIPHWNMNNTFRLLNIGTTSRQPKAGPGP